MSIWQWALTLLAVAAFALSIASSVTAKIPLWVSVTLLAVFAFLVAIPK